jgi:hypothetical protein
MSEPATPYRYFVSFAHSGPAGTGFGYTEVKRSAPVRGLDDVRSMAELLEDGTDRTVVIISFQRFPDVPDQGVDDTRR